jgi:hypothetical protein
MFKYTHNDLSFVKGLRERSIEPTLPTLGNACRNQTISLGLSPDGVSEIISQVLIVILVIAISAVIGAIVFGLPQLLQRTPYIAPDYEVLGPVGNETAVSILHLEGDPVYFWNTSGGEGIAPVEFTIVDPTGGPYSVRVDPEGGTSWHPGDFIYFYKVDDGYHLTRNRTHAISSYRTLPVSDMRINCIDRATDILVFAIGIQTANGAGNETIPQYAPGIQGNYFYDESWTQPAGSRVAPRIRFADNTTAYASDEINWPTVVGRNEFFSVSFDGSLKVDTEDDYTFYLLSDDGSWLWIDGAQVINNGGLHSPTEVKGTLHLTPGYHPIRVRMFEHTGQSVVHLRYMTPSMGAPDFVTSLWYEPATGTPPVADFSASPLAGPAGTAVRFSDRSTGATAWRWDFGDGAPQSTVQNPLHTYSGVGSYTVSLTAKNPSGSDTEAKTDYITIGPASTGISVTYYSDENWMAIAGSNTASPIRFADTASGQGSDIVNWPDTIIGKTDIFSVRCYGLLHVTNAGDYTFYLNSDDGSFLWVDGVLLVDNGGLHAPQEYSGTTQLTAGYHEVEVKMFEHTGGAVLYLQYSGPDQPSKNFVTDLWNV